MRITEQIAKHLRDVHCGGNWTAVNLKDTLADVTWQQATKQVGSLHTIAELVFHMNFFVRATIKVLRGGPLDASDKFSFDCPPITSQEDWKHLASSSFADAEELASLIEHMPDEQLAEYFGDEQYGTNYRCFHGPIEHCHYHLGQIVLLKTMLPEDKTG